MILGAGRGKLEREGGGEIGTAVVRTHCGVPAPDTLIAHRFQAVGSLCGHGLMTPANWTAAASPGGRESPLGPSASVTSVDSPAPRGKGGDGRPAAAGMTRLATPNGQRRWGILFLRFQCRIKHHCLTRVLPRDLEEGMSPSNRGGGVRVTRR